MSVKFKNQQKNACTLLSKNHAGFTLVELIVVVAIFFVIIGVTFDILISTVQRQKSVLGGQELLSQTSYVMEYVSKGLRVAIKDPDGTCLGTTGYIYLLTHFNATSGFYEGVKFINQSDNNACQEFFLDIDGVLKQIKNGSAPQNILSDKFKVKYARFIVNSDKTLHIASSSDLIQPKITILLDIQTQTPGSQQEKIIQTTVSQRNLNI